MLEGFKVIYRIALALFKQFERVERHFQSFESLVTYFKLNVFQQAVGKRCTAGSVVFQ